MTALTVTQAEAVEALLGDAVNPPPDTRQEEGTVESVDVREHRWDVQYVTRGGTRSGFSVMLGELPWAKLQVDPPRPGDEMSVYYHNGSLTVGFDLRGERLFLRSEREMTLRWLAFRATMARERASR